MLLMLLEAASLLFIINVLPAEIYMPSVHLLFVLLMRLFFTDVPVFFLYYPCRFYLHV